MENQQSDNPNGTDGLDAPSNVPETFATRKDAVGDLDGAVRNLISLTCKEDRYLMIHLFGGPTYVFFGLPERISALYTVLVERQGPHAGDALNLPLTAESDAVPEDPISHPHVAPVSGPGNQALGTRAARNAQDAQDIQEFFEQDVRGQDEFSYDLLEPVLDAQREEEASSSSRAVSARHSRNASFASRHRRSRGSSLHRSQTEAEELSRSTSAPHADDSLGASVGANRARPHVVHVHSRRWRPEALAPKGGRTPASNVVRQAFFESAYPFWAEAQPQVYPPPLPPELLYRNLLCTNDMPRPRWSEVAAHYYSGDLSAFINSRQEQSESDLNVEVTSRVSFEVSRAATRDHTDLEARMSMDYAISQVLSRVGGGEGDGGPDLLWSKDASDAMATLRRNSMEIIGRSESTLVHGSTILTMRIYSALQRDLPKGLQRSLVRTVTVYERERDGRHVQSLYAAVRAASRPCAQSWRILGRETRTVSPAVASVDSRGDSSREAVSTAPASTTLPRALARCYLILLRMSSEEVVGVFTTVPPLPETTRIIPVLRETTRGASRRGSMVSRGKQPAAEPVSPEQERPATSGAVADPAGPQASDLPNTREGGSSSSLEQCTPGYVASALQDRLSSEPDPPDVPHPFVFTLSPLGEYASFRATGANENYIMCGSSEIMVGSGLAPALYLSEDLRKCQTGRSDTYANEPLFLGESLAFLTSAVVHDIEVRKFEAKG